MYLDFLEEPQNSTRRNNTETEGVYDDYLIETNSLNDSSSSLKVHVILLDLRYNL